MFIKKELFEVFEVAILPFCFVLLYDLPYTCKCLIELTNIIIITLCCP